MKAILTKLLNLGRTSFQIRKKLQKQFTVKFVLHFRSLRSPIKVKNFFTLKNKLHKILRSGGL